MEKCQVGMLDRMLRAIVGIVLIAWAIDGQIGPWGWLGVLPFLSGVVAHCPLYASFAAMKTAR